MWRCEKCETKNEDHYDFCSICHYEKNGRPKTESSSNSFYNHREKDPIPRKYPVPDRKPKNVLKVLVIVMVVLLVIFGFLFIALIAINQEAIAIAFHCENQIQGGVEYVLQPMREILAGWQQ